MQEARTRSVRGSIVFAFAIVLALLLAYLMREILLLLYVSALFAVVLSPVIHGIMRFHIKSWHPGKGLAILLLLLSVGAAATLFFAFAMPPVVHDVQALVSELPTRGPQLLDKVHRVPFASHLNFSGLNAKLQGFASNFAEYLFLSISGWARQTGRRRGGDLSHHLFHAGGRRGLSLDPFVLPQVRPGTAERLPCCAPTCVWANGSWGKAD